MIRIGDFARISGVSVATLRHYAEVGILVPSLVAEDSGYRYYEPSQLVTLHRITVLKSLGFTLREITPVLQDVLTPERMSELLAEKKTSAEARLQVERQKVKRLELQLQIIRGLQTMTTNDVQVITLPESTVAAVRLVLPTNDQAGKLIGQAFDQLFGQLHELKIEPTGPCLAMWYGSPDDVVSETLDAAVPVDAAEASHGDLRIIRHPEQTVATVTHRGPFSEFQTCHIILKEWMAMHAYRLSGPYREVYHTPPSDNAVTEVQYPIESIHV